MKKTSTILLLLAATSTLLIVSCKKKPVGCIKITTTNIYDSIFVGKPIQVSSCSENADRQEWKMGDGSKFTYPSFSHPYSAPGMYTITLDVFNNNDKNSDEVTRQIIVYP